MSSPPPMQLEVEVGDDSMEVDAADMIPPRFTLPARADVVVDLWRTKLAEGVLSPAHFQDHWRVMVPRIYSPQPNRTCLDWSFDEESAIKLLIQPLEQFVWGSAESSQPPPPRRSTLCGKVFKQGEPAYSCRECGMDNTCVLCVECFKVSAHRLHKYKMGQSGGGGCCDCGDTEAWKRDPFCELHAAPDNEEQAQASISPEVTERMKIVASVCLSYCFRLLTLDHAPGLPNDLILKDAERDLLQILDQPDCYCTVLYNDETHTFEQVITTLMRVIKCSKRDSVELVSLIDREGRAIVKCNSFQLCDKLKTDIEMFTSRHGPALKVLVMHAHVISHQLFAMKLLTWLQNFVSQEQSLRLAVSQVALGEESGLAGWALPGTTGGVAAGVMQNDCHMWKAARTAWHRLLIATTLMDSSTKRTMAILFTKNYGSILKDFIRDDHDHSFSVSSLSVQLYTTPTLAHHLIAKHDALFVVMNTFVSECNRRCNSEGRLEFDRNHVSMAFKRAQFVLYDVKYLLGSVPTSFDDDLRKGFLHGLSLMLNLLVMMQGMDSVVRQVGQHMEYEPEWESAFNLHVKLAQSITLALEWCSAERALCASAYRMALRRHADTCGNSASELRGRYRQVGQHMEYEPEWESAFNLHVKLAQSITLALEWCSAERALCASAYRMALRRHADTCGNSASELRGRYRQVGQHMEYEPEWESAFNLHVKLAQSITLALEWCSAERALCASAYRMALRRHADTCGNSASELRGRYRQVGQHMEYEPEWESAFNLHVKLAQSITLALEWCSAERALCASAYRMALRRHADTCGNSASELRELGNQSASVIPYDVSTEPVSVHRPLSRFIAGLHLQLHRHGLSYHSREFERQDRPKPTPEELIEPVLRTMAMIAQVHAGMWRRNGFALLNQLYFYHNVKCRTEMFDRDVVMLQIGASLIESNEFIIHVLNKFNLLEWAAADFEQKSIEDDTLRHTISMVEEFLGLLITVVGSRYVPGVGEVSNEERTKKEIIQMLCVKPMPHSELNRSLPEDQLHETGLEAVIHEVADFVKPSGGNNRGVYKLKTHLYDEYDAFFHHYTREELSRSEEEQRNRRKAAGLPECCPPPPLPKLAAPFRLLANLLQCDAALHVLRCVLERALDLRTRSFSEPQVHKALHLIGYALRDEESGHYEFLAFAESAARSGLYTLLQRLATSPRVEAHQALVKWLLHKMRSLLGQGDEHLGDGENMDTDQEEKPPTNEAAEREKARRAQLAAERRAKVMAQMKSQMNKFIANNTTLFQETNSEVTEEEQKQDLTPLYRGAALGVWGGGVTEEPRVCIMCQEQARVEAMAEPMVLVAFIQCSTVLNRLGVGVGAAETWRDAWLPAGLGAQPHVSCCGHALHASCWKKYVDGVMDKEKLRPYRIRQPTAFDVGKNEYLCPLCERLCNTALPLLPSPAIPPLPPPPLSENTYCDAADLIIQLKHQVCSESVHLCTEYCEDMLCTARARSVGAASSDMEDESADEAEVYVSTHAENLLPAEFLAHFATTLPQYHDHTKTLIEDFANVLPVISGISESGGMVSVATLCRATSYTILSTNAVLLAEKRPLLGDLPSRHRDALQALIRLAALIPAMWPTPKHVSHHALSALCTLGKTSPLTHEAFSTLLALVITAPSIFSKTSGPARSTHLSRQLTLEAFRATLTRALIVTDVTSCTVKEGENPVNPDLENLLPFMKELRGGNLDIDGLDPNAAWQCVRRQCHNFLRCCCLFFHFLSDIQPSTELTEVNGDTWETMCAYLDMPTAFRDLIDNSLAKKKALAWAVATSRLTDEIVPKIVLEPSEPPRLIALPEDFSELMNVVSEFSCPNSEREDSKNPTMCLVCGQILCSQSYCCQIEVRKPGRGGGLELVGAVVAHALWCSAGAGVFLRVRECELLLLAAPSRGAMLPAPYLDTYGETDQGLRRGNPLHLCPERYEKLRMIWLSHGIYERIARGLDTNMLVATTWQNM